MSINRPDHFHPGPQKDYLTTASCSDYIHLHQQQPLSVGKNLSAPEYETDLQAKNARKWPIEMSNSGFNNPNSNNATLQEWRTNKRKVGCIQEQEQRHQQANEDAREIQSRRVPVRRSQKLSDKITALQKLVSPYGKTDTASVLQEASISIKVLQNQIQNPRGEKQLDLRSRGLCLVPVSHTQKLAEEKPN